MSERKNLGQIDLLNGPIMKALVLFAIPIFISMLFQQLYNAVDTAIVGNVLGEDSLAAIGSVSSVFDLIIHISTGLTGGFGIVIARAYGSKDEDRIKRAVAGSIMIGTASIILMTVIALFGLSGLLKLINTPEEIFDRALSYIRIIAGFLIITFAYNLFSGMLRAIGNSVMPLIFLVISSVLNVFLDYLFIAGFNTGVGGAAVATVISQAVSAVLCLIYLLRKMKILIPEKRHFVPDQGMLKELAGQGFAMVLMSSIVSISSVILQSGIKELGTQIIAGHVSARKLFSLSALPFVTMPQSVSVFVSQNRGAGQGKRILQAMRDSYIFFAVSAVVMTGILWLFAPVFVRLISGSDNPVIISNGSRYLYVLGPFLFILGIINTTRLSLQGIGDKLVPIISSIIELFGKVMFVIFLIPRFKYNAVIWCEPSIWLFMTAELLWAWNRNAYVRGIRRQDGNIQK